MSPSRQFKAARSIENEAAERSNVTTKAFWPLIDKWHINDEQALKLLRHKGGLTSTGKRPRFTLTIEEAKRVPYLKQIDFMLETIYGDAQWLAKPIREKPLRGLSPIDYMIETSLPAS